MQCPTCDYVMDAVSGGIFWCQRCGTQKGDSGMVWTPKLVRYCRKLIENSWTTEAGLAHRIRKSVTPPEALTGGEK